MDYKVFTDLQNLEIPQDINSEMDYKDVSNQQILEIPLPINSEMVYEVESEYQNFEIIPVVQPINLETGFKIEADQEILGIPMVVQNINSEMDYNVESGHQNLEIPPVVQPINSDMAYKVESDHQILEIPPLVQKGFPAGSKIVKYEEDSNLHQYLVILRLKCTSKEDFKTWLKEYERISGYAFRVLNTTPSVGKTVVYKAWYRCEHRTCSTYRLKKPSKKNTDCAAKLLVTIKSSVEGRKVRSQDSLRKEYPTIIKITNYHNHDINFGKTFKKKKRVKKINPVNLELLGEVCTSRLLAECDILPSTKNEENLSQGSCPYPTPHPVLSSQIVRNSVCREIPVSASNKLSGWEHCESKLNDITQILKTHFMKNPNGVSYALSSLHEKFSTMNTGADVISAMHNFGTYPLSPIKKTTVIPAQPTTISGKRSRGRPKKIQQTRILPKPTEPDMISARHNFGTYQFNTSPFKKTTVIPAQPTTRKRSRGRPKKIQQTIILPNPTGPDMDISAIHNFESYQFKTASTVKKETSISVEPTTISIIRSRGRPKKVPQTRMLPKLTFTSSMKKYKRRKKDLINLPVSSTKSLKFYKFV